MNDERKCAGAGERLDTNPLGLWALALTLVCAACGDGASTGAGSTGGTTHPWRGVASGFNVLVVSFDTVRADALGCYGDPRAKTPHIDRLASRGVRFERAIAPAPTTLPSHSTIFTGLEPPSHGVHNNGTFKLADEHLTLAEMLAEKGYSTAAVIAAFVLDRRYGIGQGFEHFDDQLHQDGASPGEGFFFERNAEAVTDAALGWLGRRPPERPFFLWCHYFDAHAPYRAPAPFAPKSNSVDPNRPMDPVTHRAQYLAEVSYADAELGRLLDSIDKDTLARTLIVFTSDHGEGLGEHGEFTHSRLIYEGSLRVPLIFSSPALFDGPRVVRDRIAGLVDVTPTVLGLLGLDAPRTFDGLALLESEADPERAIYSESLVPLFNHGWAPLYSYTRWSDKFISAPRPEFYDLRTDAAEQRNLYAPGEPRAAALAHALKTRLSSMRPIDVSAESELSPEELRSLAQLGYSRSTGGAPAAGVLDPKDVIMSWAVLTNARTKAEQGHFEAALADVDAILKSNPNDPFAWETAYVVHWRRGTSGEAERCIRRVIELNPTGDAYARLAQLMIPAQRHAECLEVLATAERLEPDHGEIFLTRGDCFVSQKRLDDARAQYTRALELDPVRAGAAARRGLELVERLAAEAR